MDQRRLKIGCEESPAEFSLLKWQKIQPTEDGHIYWHIVNFPAGMDKYRVVLAFEQCFAKWQQAFDEIEPRGRALTLSATGDFKRAHIRIYFLDPHLKEFEFTLEDGTKHRVTNRWPMDGPLGKLAHRPPASFDLHFDASEAWSEIHKACEKTGTIQQVQLWQVAMHEMGHVFDLGHSDVPEAIMYPTYDGKHTEITADDREGLQKAWGKIKRQFVHLIPPAAISVTQDPKVLHVQYQLPKKTAYKKRALAAITQIVVHHSADNGTPQSIASYHVSKGWPGIGYHYVIAKDGTVHHTNDIDEASYNVAQQNTRSLGICLIGNYEKDTPPDNQVAALKWLVKTLRAVIGDVDVVGHRDRVATACPGKNLYEIVKTLN